MKKILTLLLAAGAFVTVQAQSREETRGVILGDGGYGKNNPSTQSRDVILGGDNRDAYPAYPSTDRQRKKQKVYRDERRYDRDNDCNKNKGKHKGWYKKEKNKNWKKGHRH